MIEQSKASQFGISLAGVSFAYGTNTLFSELELRIPQGQIWAMVGRSGVGKTTLLQIVAGLFKPSTGEISIAGREAVAPGSIKGIVFQEDCLLGWLTAEENVLFPEHKRATPEMRSRAGNLLTSVGLNGLHAKMPNELSVGMRKRIEFARALMNDTKFILADEPFGTVDALTRRELWDLWLKLRRNNPRTGILSTHDPEEAVRLCDAVVTLQQSKGGVKLSEPIVMPDEVRRLGSNEESEHLITLKKAVLSSLKY